MSGITPPRFDRAAFAAFVVAAITLVASGFVFRAAVGQLNIYLRKEPVPLAKPLAVLPGTLGPWKAIGEDERFDAAQVEELGTTRYLSRMFQHEDGTLFHLHIAYYTGMIDAVPHIPDRCFVAGGWDPVGGAVNEPLTLSYDDAEADPDHVNTQTGERYELLRVDHPLSLDRDLVRLPIGDAELRVLEFSNDRQAGIALWGGYFFIANHRLTASPAVIRSLAFRPSERYAYYCKIQVTARLKGRDTRARYLELAGDLIERLTPHLMRCLPDWTQYETADPREG